MQDIEYSAGIWYANILQLIWPLINTNTDMEPLYIFSPHLIADIKSFL